MENKEQVFDKIYRELKDKIFRLCLGFTGNEFEANDLFQEIMILIWNNLHKFRNESSISTWVYRIAANRALLYVNTKKRKDSLFQEIDKSNKELSQIFEENDNQFYTDEKIKFLYKAISELNEFDRIIISLTLEGYSYAEISEVTGLNTSHVGVKINRIKKVLKTKLEKI